MTLNEFRALNLGDRVIYRNKVITVKEVWNCSSFRGIMFQHDNRVIYPDCNDRILFWSDEKEDQKLINQMIKISPA